VDLAALLARMKAHSHDPVVQAECCFSLHQSGQQADASALAFLPLIVAALRAHPGAAQLLTSGCALLGHMCVDRSEDELVAAGVADGIAAVVDVMRAHPADAKLHSLCGMALHSMVMSPGLRDVAVRAGAMPALAAALQAHVLCTRTANLICLALNKVVAEHRLASAQAGDAGAVAAVLAMARAHPASVALQALACHTLAALACDDANKVRAIRAGAIEAILQAMHAHAADDNMQGNGCKTLGVIAKDHTALISARSSSLLGDACTAVVAAMNAHGTHAYVQHHGCFALFQIFFKHGVHLEAHKAGAVTALVAAFRTHPADAKVQELGFAAATFLCTRNAAVSIAASRAGALQAIVAVLRAHPANTRVQVSGCNTLDSIVQAHPRTQAAAGAAGAVEAIAAALRMTGINASVQEFGCGALLTMIHGHRGNAERACAAGAMEALADVISASSAVEHIDAFRNSVAALDGLLDGNEDAARQAINAGMMDVMAHAVTPRLGPTVREMHTRIARLLQAAAQRHDAAACTHAGCKRCAGARNDGRMCALPGCGARKRGDGSGKGLLRCGACRRVAFCGAAHQREAWVSHKTECAALCAADAGDEEDDE
jgi:hypothetical protein